MAKQINSYTKMNIASTYTRANGQPLDDTLVWNSLSSAQEYTKTDKAYVGQVISVVENGESKAYIIKDIDGTLEEVGGALEVPSQSFFNSLY